MFRTFRSSPTTPMNVSLWMTGSVIVSEAPVAWGEHSVIVLLHNSRAAVSIRAEVTTQAYYVISMSNCL